MVALASSGSILAACSILAAGGAMWSACSSVTFPDATGGASGAGAATGAGGLILGTGGGACGIGGAAGDGPAGNGPLGDGYFPGSCVPQHHNPDSQPGGACAAECQTVSCGKACTEDCCVPCGIDAQGFKVCTCPNPCAGPYANCTCSPPAFIPAGLHGGPCSPQGYSTASVPSTAPDGAISLRGLPCKETSLVCFTADSTPVSERGCICEADGLMHCGSVNHWFVNDATATEWMP
jgi:hypothetical protein